MLRGNMLTSSSGKTCNHTQLAGRYGRFLVSVDNPCFIIHIVLPGSFFLFWGGGSEESVEYKS